MTPPPDAAPLTNVMEPLILPAGLSSPKDSLKVCCKPQSVGKPKRSLLPITASQSATSLVGRGFHHQDSQWDRTCRASMWSRDLEPFLQPASPAQDTLLRADHYLLYLPQKTPQVQGLQAIRCSKTSLGCSKVVPLHTLISIILEASFLSHFLKSLLPRGSGHFPPINL